MRVLIVSYYFPPSGGPGVQRTLKFTRYLPARGIEPYVLTVREEDAAYPSYDRSLVDEVPGEIRVERTRAIDPYAAYARLLGKDRDKTIGVGFIGESEPDWKQRLARWVRANVFLPDARVGWVPFAIGAANRLVRKLRLQAIWTTGPPHSTHLIGDFLSRRHGLPWVADFRDPWTDIDYADMLPSTRLASALDAALERRVLRQADVVTVVTPSMARGFSQRVGRDYELLVNGFDPRDFDDSISPERDRFVIAHVGYLNGARNPSGLWRALSRARANERMRDLHVRLIGRVDPTVDEEIERRGLGDVVERVPYLEHGDAVREMQKASLLLLVINRVPGAEGILTGKLFEYIGSGRPVVCIGPPEGDAAEVLRDASAGRVFDYGDVSGIEQFVTEHLEAWRSGAPKSGASPAQAAKYDRSIQAEHLAAVLKDAAGRRKRR